MNVYAKQSHGKKENLVVTKEREKREERQTKGMGLTNCYV